MNSNENIRQGHFLTTEALKYYMDQLRADNNEEALNELGRVIFDGVKQANREYANGVFSQEQVFQQFTEAIESDLKESPHTSKITCQRGCNFCCHIKVDVNYFEAKWLYDYCKKNNIEINWDYLIAQSSMDDDKQWVQQKHLRTCEFLKNGECSVYEARPMGCRKHFSLSKPEECDVDKVSNMIAKPLLLNAEVYSAAIWNSQVPSGTLSQMLLKVKEDDETGKA